MNRSDIKARILDGINDDSSSPVFFTDTQLNDLIDEAAEFIVGETRSVRKSVFLPLRAGTTFYSLKAIAPDVLLPYRVWSHTNDSRLTVTSMEELDRFQERWLDTSSANPEMWFPVSWDLIGLYPHTISAGGTIRIDYFAWPSQLLDDEDTPDLLVATHDAIVLYGKYIGLLKTWDAQRAAKVFQELRGQEMFAKARSGILRIGHRSFGRSPDAQSFPSTIRSEE